MLQFIVFIQSCNGVGFTLR